MKRRILMLVILLLLVLTGNLRYQSLVADDDEGFIQIETIPLPPPGCVLASTRQANDSAECFIQVDEPYIFDVSALISLATESIQLSSKGLPFGATFSGQLTGIGHARGTFNFTPTLGDLTPARRPFVVTFTATSPNLFPDGVTIFVRLNVEQPELGPKARILVDRGCRGLTYQQGESFTFSYIVEGEGLAEASIAIMTVTPDGVRSTRTATEAANIWHQFTRGTSNVPPGTWTLSITASVIVDGEERTLFDECQFIVDRPEDNHPPVIDVSALGATEVKISGVSFVNIKTFVENPLTLWVFASDPDIEDTVILTASFAGIPGRLDVLAQAQNPAIGRMGMFPLKDPLFPDLARIGIVTVTASDGVHRVTQLIRVVAFPKDFWMIPVVVNILNNAGITKEDAGKVIKEASKILDNANKNLRVRLKVVGDIRTGVTAGDDGSGGGTPGDGDLTLLEGRNVRTAGATEIDKLRGTGGIKVIFARTPWVGQSVAAWSIHEFPVVILQKRASIPDTGQTIAHEITHILTIGSRFKPSTHSHDPNNLTHESLPGRDLADFQAAEIRSGLPLHGRSITKKSPGQKVEHQYGAKTDAIDDIAAGVKEHLDLFRIIMSSEVGIDHVDTLLAIDGLLPDLGAVDATYSMLFDTDANTETGLNIAGFSGIDKEVRIDVAGVASIAPLVVSGTVIDHLGGDTEIPLPSIPQLSREPRLDVRPMVDVQDQISFAIPKSMLKLTALDVPVNVVSYDADMIAQDTMSLIFDADAFEDIPTLALFQGGVRPGDSLPFEISDLLPDSDFSLFVDEELVFSNTVDSTGGFAGSFAFPLVPTGDYFLIAEDSSGEFAFNVIEVTPTLVGGITSFLTEDSGSSESGIAILAGSAAGAFAILLAGIRYTRRRWLGKPP